MGQLHQPNAQLIGLAPWVIGQEALIGQRLQKPIKRRFGVIALRQEFTEPRGPLR